MTYLPDTNAFVSFLRKKVPNLVARWLSTSPGEIAVSSIVLYELRVGAETSSNPTTQHAKLDRFLTPYQSLVFDSDTARICARVRADLERVGTPIGPHDMQIAANALQHDLILVTHNTREFSRVVGLKLEDWEL